ncbi:myb-like protein J [Microplitis demolitor]|uniref:myb-like protein J n=1 Tax=Microplitis demolitor TaxID=69319 RepID=UPI0004CCF4F0|nr:myb-like protein J [Microplitis demolitor]
MVCKENVVSWFGNLSSHKRIDIMCTLLNMCLPFEVRYLGTCIEDRGKRDYNDLRDTEHHANNPADLAELANLGGVTDTRARRKLVLYVALLHGCNYECAKTFYKSLANFDTQEMANSLANQDEPLEELILLYTMALNHPAFSYDQKTTFGNIFLKLQEEEEARINAKQINTGYKPGFGACGSNERLCDQGLDVGGMPGMMPPPIQQQQQQQQQHYADIFRGNPMVAGGIPPNMSMPPPPPGLCLPPAEQMINHPQNHNPAQYLHLGFPAINSIGPWTGQTPMMIGNNHHHHHHHQMMYHTVAPSGDMIVYPASPLVSRPSSPVSNHPPPPSRSPPSRSDSPGRRSMRSWSIEERTSNANQTNTTSTTPRNVTSSNQSASRSIPSVPVTPMTTPTSGAYSRHNSLTTSTSTSTSTTSSTSSIKNNNNNNNNPPAKLRSPSTSITGTAPAINNDTLRETLGKEMPNYKACLQNYSMEEIRRISDEELREIGLTQNAVGQLRNIIRPQSSSSTNGQNQMEKNKIDNYPAAEQTDEVAQQQQEVNEFYSPKIPGPALPFFQDFHQSIHHHHHHHHHHHSHLANITSIRRYQTMQPPPMDPNQQLSVFPPPSVYATQNPCYACLTVPAAAATTTVGMQNRYPRCNAQHMYCVAQLQALRLDADSSRHCSQSSSSDGSTGSRSPPGTPPAAWSGNSTLIATSTVINENTSVTTTTTVTATSNTSEQTPGTSVLSYSTVALSRQNTSGIQQQQQQQQINNDRARSMKKNQMRQKNQMINGVTNNSTCSVSPAPIPLPSSINLSTPPPQQQQQQQQHIPGFPSTGNHPITFLPHGNHHFPGTTPRLPLNNTNIYSTNYSHTIYSRPTVTMAPGFQPTTPQGFQQNGELIYQYPQPGTPPPPPPLPPPGIVTGLIPIGHHQKISCYNCGSNSHLAVDCKEQTMEDLTRRAQYRLDFTIPKQSTDCPNDE